MKIVTVLFGANASYKKMAKVLEYSAKKNSPSCQFELRNISSAEANGLASKYRQFCRSVGGHTINNALKTTYHNQIVQEAENGELLCLIDADTMITGDLSTVREIDFDIAVTDKEGAQQRAPINSGVVFVRVSDQTKKFYNSWNETAISLLRNPRRLKELRRKYLGINQSALAEMMKSPHGLNLVLLPCRIWNSTTCCWDQFNENTKVVHVLGALRKAVQKQGGPNQGKVIRLLQLWRRFEKEAGGVA